MIPSTTIPPLSSIAPHPWNKRLVMLLCSALALLHVVAVVRSAWLCDDAYINLRTVWNFASGRGLVWNPVERVQSFTSPLWLLIFALIHKLIDPTETAVVLSTLGVSFLFGLAAALVLVFGVARDAPARLLVLAGLFGSKAMTEFTTGGLENPLCHLALAVLCAVWFSPGGAGLRPLWLGLAACVLCLARLDLVLMTAPVLALEIWERRDWRTVGLMALAFLPLLGWELFSIAYYGFPFPNTAYAKLSSSVGWMVRVRQGMGYFSNSLRWDYPTLAVIAIGLAGAFMSGDRRCKAVAAGVGLYLLYVLRIGGDFMSGRLFTPPAAAALALIGSCRWDRRVVVILGASLILAPLITRHPLSPWKVHREFGEGVADIFGVADERRWFGDHTGSIQWPPGGPPLRNTWVADAVRDRAAHNAAPFVVVMGNIGYYGFFAGPEAFIVDHYALSDALLARLEPKARIFKPGHLERQIPEGYIETLRMGRNVIKDPVTARLYDDLVLVTRGPLWTRDRWLAILRLNLGATGAK